MSRSRSLSMCSCSRSCFSDFRQIDISNVGEGSTSLSDSMGR